MRPFVAIPLELREPDVVFRVNLCEFALCEWDFAVVAEAVSIDGQGVFRPVVFFNGIVVGVAELPACIIIFYGWPAGLARCGLDRRGVYNAVEATGNQPGKVAVGAVSSLPRLSHRAVLFGGVGCERMSPP